MLVDISRDQGLGPIIRAHLEFLRAMKPSFLTSFGGQEYLNNALLRTIDMHEQEHVPFREVER